MRGRLKDAPPQPTASFDQGKPVTIAATKWVEVTPVKNIVNVKLEHPAKARPGRRGRGRPASLRRRRQAACRRSDVLDGRSGGAVACQGTPARSAARFHRRARNENGGARHAQHGVRRHSARGDRRRRRRRTAGMGRREQYFRAQEFHARADLSAEREDRRRWRRQNQGAASRYADRVQAARQGGERAGSFRRGRRRNADPSGARRAAGAAALHPAGRRLRYRTCRAHRRRARRRRQGVDRGAGADALGRNEPQDRMDAEQAGARRSARRGAGSTRGRRDARLPHRARRRSARKTRSRSLCR